MDPKIFNDSVYHHIGVPSVCVKIVNTRQFQRLRHLKQMGMRNHVYPGANHTRFEHCIGVCYLAGKAVRRLQEVHGKEMITDHDVARVEIAGLCHDLGHGPMSHLFEKVTKVNHEQKSWEMFQLLIDENELGQDLEIAAGSEALVLINDLLHKLSEEEVDRLNQNQRQALEEQQSKRYLYQIVANDETGVDVDRWDYFARDTFHLGINHSFQYDRILPNMRICDCIEKGKAPFKGIAYRDKVKADLLVMFRTRFNLYDQACEHRVGQAVDYMILDAFEKIKDVPFLNVPGKSQQLSLKQASEDIRAYQCLDDRIVKIIQNSKDDKLKPAKEIFDRIDRRDFYTFVGQVEATDKDSDVPGEVIDALKKEDISVIAKTTLLHYGQRDKSPFDAMFFYTKYDKEKARHATEAELPRDLPKKWQYCFYRFFVKTQMDGKEKKRVHGIVKEVLNNYQPHQTIPSTPPSQTGPTVSQVRHKKDSRKRRNTTEMDKIKKKLPFSEHYSQ